MNGEHNVENITQSLKGLSLLLRNNKLFEDALRVFLFPYLFFSMVFDWTDEGPSGRQALKLMHNNLT